MTLPYHLTVEGFAPDHFRVLAFTGREAISKAWWFRVATTVKNADDLDRAPLGRRAVLTWNVGAGNVGPRAFYGVVSSSRIDDRDGNVRVHLRIVPRLQLLDRQRRTRIFQKQRVPDIVTAVLAEAGIGVRWQLKRAYPVREYCTQYEETDYAFVRRLLAEAAIYFYFPSGPAIDDGALAAAGAVSAALGAAAGAVGSPLATGIAGAASPLVPGDTVVCADDATFYPPIGGDDAGELLAASAAALVDILPGAGAALGAAASAIATVAAPPAPTLYYLAMIDGATLAADKITPFALRGSVRSNRAVFRDYDPERPMAPLRSEAASMAPFPPPATAALDAGAAIAGAAGVSVTGGAAVAAFAGAAGELLGQPSLLPLEIYDHHGPFLFPKWGFTGDEAARMLRQARRRAVVAEGESGCSALSAGHRFSLSDHPVAQLDGPYAVTTVDHRGEAEPRADAGRARQIYTCSFACVPASMTFVPKRPRRESVQVALTATVVGPPGEEIHVDAMGQIKVQFHWDREGRGDDHSSCWIRTMHPWGGAGWGVQFIPRVGMEVVVTFEGGDPDKPMVLGALYNGTHPSPFPLPGDKSRSGWRTNTYPGGQGFNELSFEDARGKEQVRLHAQRDHDEVVENDHTLRVGNDERIDIVGNRMDTIEKNHRRRVDNDEVVQVVGHRTTTIGRDLEEVVKGDHKSQVDGDRIDVVTGNADERVSGMLMTRVEGKERRHVEDAAELEYADDLTTRVNGCLTTLVGRQDKKRSWVTHAEGTAELSGLDLLRLSSEKELVLSVGKSSIRITPDRIELISASISAKGGTAGLSISDSLALSAKADAVVFAKTINLLTDAPVPAQVKLTDEVKITGTMVKLNPPITDQEKAEDPKQDPPTKIALADQEGGSLAYQRFVVTLDDGTEVGGLTDADGNAELELPTGGKVVFPDVTMPGDAATGEPKPYVVRQGDYLAKLAATYGFDADKVWNDPANAEVNAQRKNPNLLHPGDILRFPRAKRKGLPLAKGTTNEYAAKVPKTSIRLGFKNAKGPIAGEPYIVEGLGAPQQGTTDGDGMVTIKVPVHVREVRVVFAKLNLSYPVRIGDMDPVDEPAGVRKRLQHLGFQAAPSEGGTEAELEARDRAAVAAFQRAQGIEPTGELDDATKAAIVKEHGS